VPLLPSCGPLSTTQMLWPLTSTCLPSILPCL
jgi:hypothetical protein